MQDHQRRAANSIGAPIDLKNIKNPAPLGIINVRGVSNNSIERVNNFNQNSKESVKASNTNMLQNLKVNGSGTSGVSTGLNKEMSSLLKSPLKTAQHQFLPITDSMHKKNVASHQF
jgi:hypothetical protein